jgi:hypothetical protein
MLQTKIVEKLEIRILYSITFFENHTIYDIMWKNTLEWARPQMTVWCMLHTQGYDYTHRLCITYCFFHSNNGCTNTLQCYVIHTLPVLSLPYLSTLQTLMYSCLIFSQSSNVISRLIAFFMPLTL